MENLVPGGLELQSEKLGDSSNRFSSNKCWPKVGSNVDLDFVTA